MSGAGTGIEAFVFKGSRFLGSRCFSAGAVVIGRAREAGLRLQDPSVEERHAMVRLEGSDLVIADTSQTGMLVNGEPIALCRIGSLDEVSIGPFRLKFSILGQEEEDPGFGAEPSVPGAAVGTPSRAELEAPDTYVTPREAEREDATLPRYDLHSEHEGGDFDEMETRAGRPNVRKPQVAPFSAREALTARSEAVPDFDEYAQGARTTKRASPSSEFGSEAPTRKASLRGRAEPAQPPAAEPEVVVPAAAARPARGKAARQAQPEPEPEPLPARPARGKAAKQPAKQPEPEPEPPVETKPARSKKQKKKAEPEPEPEASAPLEEPLPPDEMFAGELAPEGDDEDEEEPWVEPFSLLENVVRERFKTPIESEPPCIEVIHYADNEITNLMRGDAGEVVAVGADRFELIKLENDGRALLYFRKDMSGTLVSKGKARPMKAFCTDNYLVDRDDELFGVVMQEGDYAQVLREGQGYLVRFVRPPVLPRAKTRFGLSLGALQAALGSAAVHILVGVLMVVMAGESGLAVENDSERFAKVALKDVALEKAMEEPKKEMKKEEPPPPPKDVPKETPKQVVTKQKLPKVKVVSNVPLTPKQKERAAKKVAANVMSALENLKPAGITPGRSDLKALASNISAVRSPGGSAANFKISGVIGRGIGDGVRLAGGLGGGGGKDTRVGSQLLAGGAVGKISASAGTGTRVRGKVAKAPPRAITTSGGSCDREVIQRVVGGNMAAVQACYERQLLTTPGLSGKIVFDWTIVGGGGVGSARMTSSSMASPMVATCILSLIRTWRFSPCPIGGNVDVRYPFVFRVQGF